MRRSPRSRSASGCSRPPPAAELKRLDRIAALILDDLGYVQQSREEMEALFTLVAERYERRSLLITTNLVFSRRCTI